MGFDLLTKAEAAKQARISTRFLDKQIIEGTGPAVTRIGRRVLVRSDAFQEWIERCTANSGPRAACGGGTGVKGMRRPRSADFGTTVMPGRVA